MTTARRKLTGRTRRHRRVRKRVRGTAERPRLCVFRSLRCLYAQVIDDDSGRVLAAANSREPGVLGGVASPRTTAAAQEVGRAIAERAKAASVTRVVFDRGGYLFHGRVRAIAQGAREAGLDF